MSGNTEDVERSIIDKLQKMNIILLLEITLEEGTILCQLILNSGFQFSFLYKNQPLFKLFSEFYFKSYLLITELCYLNLSEIDCSLESPLDSFSLTKIRQTRAFHIIRKTRSLLLTFNIIRSERYINSGKWKVCPNSMDVRQKP